MPDVDDMDALCEGDVSQRYTRKCSRDSLCEWKARRPFVLAARRCQNGKRDGRTQHKRLMISQS